MPPGNESIGIAIAGAASLRGKDLKQWLGEGKFPAGEIRLIDEENAAGTLTEVGGEPAVIQPVDDSSFQRLRFVFFTGSGRFATQHGAAAERAGATVIDLTGALSSSNGARSWIPGLDGLLGSPGDLKKSNGHVQRYLAPSAPAIVACSLSAALKDFSPERLVIVFFQPVSERGQEGVEELESQTTKLLALQPMPQAVFDTQVAFNMLDRWGADSSARLSDARTALAQEVKNYLGERARVPAMTLVQAPVFFGHTFTAYAEFSGPRDPEAFAERLSSAGFVVAGEDDPAPSNISVAGEAQPAIGRAVRDTNVDNGYWFWGAADNLRVATANATRIAEALLAS